MEGGNLLTNGAGLGVATTALLEKNFRQGQDHSSIARLLREHLGIQDLMYLNALVGEETGHVDMFLAFLAPDRVVVAECDPKADPENARILDETADALARVQTDRGPMRVNRIPMTPSADGVWRTYTNVIFANGVLIVPTYSTVDPAIEQKALQVYRRLLPNWKVVGVNADALAAQGGSLHCVSLNIPGFVSARRLLHAPPPPAWSGRHGPAGDQLLQTQPRADLPDTDPAAATIPARVGPGQHGRAGRFRLGALPHSRWAADDWDESGPPRSTKGTERRRRPVAGSVLIAPDSPAEPSRRLPAQAGQAASPFRGHCPE
jgi:hypothetical protein